MHESLGGPGQSNSSANHLRSGFFIDVSDASPGTRGIRRSRRSPSSGYTSSPKQGGKWEQCVGIQMHDVESRVI